MAKRANGKSSEQRVSSIWFEWADRAIFLAIAVLLLVAAAALVVYDAITFARHATDGFLGALVEFLTTLLLVLIVMEVFGTVRNYLATGTTSLKPFLYVGIISAIRRILAVGAETAVVGPGEEERVFRLLVLDLGVNAGVVLALAAALFLFGRQDPRGTDAPLREAEEEAEEYRG